MTDTEITASRVTRRDNVHLSGGSGGDRVPSSTPVTLPPELAERLVVAAVAGRQ